MSALIPSFTTTAGVLGFRLPSHRNPTGAAPVVNGPLHERAEG